MRSAVRNHLAALMMLVPAAAVLVAAPAEAQQRVVVSQPAIRALGLNSNAGLAPGAVLRVQLVATAGARNADVVLADGVRVALREQGAGNYVGTHTIRRGDRIDPLQLIAAHATFGGRTVVQNFSFPAPFQALAMGGPAAVATTVAIEQFTVRPQGRLVPGRELRFRLEGAAGGRASLDIPGVVSDVALRETRRGVYEGTYTVRRRDDLQAFDSAVATLRVGGHRATARVDLPEARADRRDEQAPRVTQLAPSDGARVAERGRTFIQARLSDNGSGVDPQSVRLLVDGLDVTRNSRITADEIGYREELGRGRHNAELIVHDRAGNVTRTAWTFQVV